MASSVERRIREAGILDTDADSLEEQPQYLRALTRRTATRNEIIAGLVADNLDAVVYPPSTVLPVEIPDHQPFSEMRCELAAHTGLPAIVLQAGFAHGEIPVGLELLGRPFAEPRLIELAYGFEQLTDFRRPPKQFV
jgi:Asp-tRNAAsn/Glu-tRNAGln amidotransferase A subunit and related amidases